jgi:hypothetical protein
MTTSARPTMTDPERLKKLLQAAAAADRLRQSIERDLNGTAEPEQGTQQGWQANRIKKLLSIAFPPDGRVPSNLTLQAIQTRLRPTFEKNGWKVPSTDSISRACGRRGRRG